MPIYDYACTECGEVIEVRATMTEKEKGLNLKCPKCGGKKLARVFGNFAVGRSSKSVAGTAPCCGPRSGPTCCR